MTTYFDTSALVKLLIDEPGSDIAARILDDATTVTASRLGYVEGRATVARAQGARLGDAEVADARRELDLLWREIVAIVVEERIIEQAASLADRHRLRGADAVHLASALATDGGPVRFACFDADLRAAAKAEGLELVPEAA